jgi:hypothetical protein
MLALARRRLGLVVSRSPRERHADILRRVRDTLPEGGRFALTVGGSEHPAFTDTMFEKSVILFRAVYDIARERKFEYTFSLPPGQGQPAGATSTGSEGRRVAIVTKVFMTHDAKTSLKELLGADYTEAAQRLFNLRGYQSVAQLAKMFGGRGM